MTSSGSGIGYTLPVNPSSGSALNPCGLPLHRYAALIGYSECAFYGVSSPANADYFCRQIWTLQQRNDVEFYLCEASQEIAREIGFPLAPTWFTSEQHQLYHNRGNAILGTHTRWGKVLEFGTPVETMLMEDAPVVIADICTVTFPVTLTSVEGIVVYYPNTKDTIIPSAIDYATGVLTISIPKCRMVGHDYLNTPEGGIDYQDDIYFQDTVDVTQITTDPTNSGALVWPAGTTGACAADALNETTRGVKVNLLNPETGYCSFIPATYAGGVWTQTNCSFGNYPSYVRLNYKAGITALTRELEMIIVRLAHAKMPAEPCGCEVMQRLWARDHHIPDLMTRERLECPFGMNDGAWAAWKFSQSIKRFRVGVL